MIINSKMIFFRKSLSYIYLCRDCIEEEKKRKIELRVIFNYLGNILSVSYTHLRAHETEADLVCRLLLEKKK